MPARETADAIRSGRISSRETVLRAIRRVKELNPLINAVVELREEEALREADRADAAVRGGTASGAFLGVPITVKDNIAVAGMHCTASHPPLRANIPTEDAVVVRRLRMAGAIVIGKTNLPELAMDLQTRSPLFGVTNNPWDLSRTPGGSSGGEAAAVSSGMSFLGVGNDLLASIRLPAHFCGLYSLLPSEGLIPLQGFVPGGPPGGLMQKFLRMGFLTRSLEDLAAALEACAGPHPSDPYLFPRPARTLKEPRGNGAIRIGWTLAHGKNIRAGAETRRVVSDFARRLSAAGCDVKELPHAPVEPEKVIRVWVRAFGSAMGLRLPPAIRFLAGLGNPALRPDLRACLAAEAERIELIQELESFFSGCDILITPVSPTPAFPHMTPAKYRGPSPVYTAGIDVDGSEMDYASATAGFALPYAITGNPTVTVPAGFSRDGLPIGIQAVGRRFGDFALLDSLIRCTAGIASFAPPPEPKH